MRFGSGVKRSGRKYPGSFELDGIGHYDHYDVEITACQELGVGFVEVTPPNSHCSRYLGRKASSMVPFPLLCSYYTQMLV